MIRLLRNSRGFTLLHLVFIIIALSVAAGVAVRAIDQQLYESRKMKTIKQIQEIQRAIHGDPRLRDQSDFGFVGDLERLPKNLNELIAKPGGQDGKLWKGPYLSNDFLEDTSDPFLDAWGNPIQYDNTTGQLGISTASIGNEQIVIPESFENPEEILYGGIQGNIVDSLGNPPPKGHRRHIYIAMEPVYTEPWPAITVDVNLDMELFHMHRVWALTHVIRNGIDWFCDAIDDGRRHWSDKPPKNAWRWLPEGEEFNIYDNDYDDHETEYDTLGVARRFDPHFDDFWGDYNWKQQNVATYEKIQVFIHPDRFGEYFCQNIPVKPYLLTCYHDLYEVSIKKYVVIPSNMEKTVNFRFPVVFEQPDTAGSGGGAGMAQYLDVTGSLVIDGTDDYGVFISNTGTTSITIDTMYVAWSGAAGNERLNEIAINTVSVWTGSQKTAKEANIVDTTLPAGATNYPLYFRFNRSSVAGKQLSLIFYMSDGSRH